jgi:hypothetical protein
MSEEEGSGDNSSDEGGYVPPVALMTLDSNNNNVDAHQNDESDAAKDMVSEKLDNSSDDKEESTIISGDEAVVDAAATVTTAESSSGAGGLFAGLSLSPSAATSGSGVPAAAKPSLEEDASTDINKQQPPSRAPTPVHSNASPPVSPEFTKQKVSPNIKAPIPLAAATKKPTDHHHKKKKSTTASTIKSTKSENLMLQLTILPPSSSSSFKKSTTMNTDTTLRLLRKFYNKSSPSIPQHAGGTQPVSWYGWMFGPSAETAGNEDPALKCYQEFTSALGVGGDEMDSEKDGNGDNNDTATSSNSEASAAVGGVEGEDDVIVESILGHKDDSPSKARRTLSSFIQLVHCWCLTSAQVAEALLEKGDDANAAAPHTHSVITEELLSLAISTASSLVAHGCLDDLYVNIGHPGDSGNNNSGGAATTARSEDEEIDEILDSTATTGSLDSVGAPSFVRRAVNVLAESVFAADLSFEQVELAALKFLLTTGCRVAACSSEEGDENVTIMEPMLRGTHLLQTIRICSHVYLQTGSKPNRTTAKAALQQLVISVFVRLERAIEQLKVEEKVESSSTKTTPLTTTKSAEETFASQDHRDAYLVLRSLCKLSMQTRANHHSNERSSGGGGVSSENSSNATTSTPVVAAADSPDTSHADKQALQSRILALELLLHILRHKSGGCILYAGPQFHYAIRQYLCTSLLKNTTSPDTTIVELSLRLFVPLIRNFRSLLKTEIEAFVTNVFFVILDSKNSTNQHKLLVVTLFEEICSDATTLAEIFLNYDCDLSAVDLFQRIVNALGKVARVGLTDATGTSPSLQFVAGAGATRAEKMRQDHRELRLAAMNALRQVLASLHSSIATPVNADIHGGDISVDEALTINGSSGDKMPPVEDVQTTSISEDANGKKSLVEMYDSKKKRREEESQAALKFNQKPAAGLKYASERGHLDADDPVDVARYLLQNKDLFDKAQIGEYLGREKEWQDGFALKVLRAYGEALDFKGMEFDEAIRYYLSGFRLPGEAQKIDRIMEVFAARYTDQNSGTFPTADAAFILAFSIIMLNTDLHNPAIKEERKMTIQSFIRMNSGVCDGGDFPDEMLTDIFNRIKTDPISLKEDDDARESAGIKAGGTAPSALSTASDFFFGNHYIDEDKARETNYQKEGDQIVRDTESMLRRRRKATKHPSSKKALRDSLKKRTSVNFVGTADTGLKDEYVTPMFDVTWGPALAVFSTAIESANITESALSSIATEEEMDHAVENAASVIEVSLNGFQLAICIAGICGNDTARDAYVRALYNFTLLGKGRLLSSRHIHCVQSLLKLGIDDGELLGVSWEHIFRALAEVNRLQQIWEGKARSDRKLKAQDRAAKEASVEDDTDSDTSSDYDDINFPMEDEMDKKGIDEANAKAIYAAISLNLVDSIFQRSSSLSRPSLKDFVYQLCRVSRMEISGYGGHVGSDANDIDLTNDHYMKHHTLVSESSASKADVGGSQPEIYSLQKLVEVTQFNMESRPRLIFADIWGTISTHLTSTALHEEAAVAMFAVDSLRQLSMQFLNREELGVFEFQRRFLKPLETIMSRSTHVSVKEHLLSSVEQLILIYGFDDRAEPSEKTDGGQKRTHQGTLRSGWRSVLFVLGTAGLDKNDTISSRGFQLLSAQIQQCVSICRRVDGDTNKPASLLTEHFVDLVAALLLYVSGQNQNLSSKALDSIIQLSDLLAEGKVSVTSTRHKTSTPTSPDFHNDELELWWPILLGLSKTMGDRRHEVRVKGLQTLLSIVNKHFFPSKKDKDVEENGDTSPQHGDLQTLQLVFRGILVPALEFEEMDGNSTSGFAPELLPPKFVHFITAPSPNPSNASDKGRREWIGTTFDHLIDGCVSICLKSMEAFDNDSLVEEVLAMLNSCLLSDSGHLAVRGLRRLQQFVTKDLDLKDVTDDTWATVSHMLFRVLSIRGMPPLAPEVEGATDEQKDQLTKEYEDTMDEFIREQKLFSNRRYIGCNAAMVIGSLLTTENIVGSMGLHWYIFLMSGLGKGIKDWERAAEIMKSSNSPQESTQASPPDYLENVLYARRWMTKFILSLTSQTDATTLENTQFQHVLKEETESLLYAFLKKEADESCSSVDMRNVSKMVTDILEGFNGISDEKLATMKWLSPVLSTCIQTNNTSLRTSVQILLTRLTQQMSQSES